MDRAKAWNKVLQAAQGLTWIVYSSLYQDAAKGQHQTSLEELL